MKSDQITTGVDKLVSLIEERKRISVNDAAKELSLPSVVIEEWADFLFDQGVINSEYKFATRFLIKREMTKDEVEKKSKDFEGRKEGFIRKVEATIDFIGKESAGLKSVKDDFGRLSQEIEADVKKVRSEFTVLENYERIKKNIDREIIEQQHSFKRQMESLEASIFSRQKSYEELVSHIKDQELRLDEEINRSELLRKNEDILRSRLRKIQDAAKMMEDQIRKEDSGIAQIRGEISRMKRFAEQLRQFIESREKDIAPLMERSRLHQKKIEDMEEKIIQKVIARKKEIGSTVSETRKVKEKFERFFEQKVNIDVMMDRINTDLSKLKQELNALIVEARMLELSNPKRLSKHVGDLEAKFDAAERKRQKFEKEIFALGKLLKSKSE